MCQVVSAGQLESGKAPLTPEVPPGQKKQVQGRAVLCARMCGSSQLFWLSVARMESGRGRPGSPHFSTLLNPHGAAWCTCTAVSYLIHWIKGGRGTHSTLPCCSWWSYLQEGCPGMHYCCLAGWPEHLDRAPACTIQVEGECKQWCSPPASLLLKSSLRPQRVLKVPRSSLWDLLDLLISILSLFLSLIYYAEAVQLALSYLLGGTALYNTYIVHEFMGEGEFSILLSSHLGPTFYCSYTDLTNQACLKRYSLRIH